MKMRIVAVGLKMPSWVDIASQDYLHRFGGNYTLELKAVKAPKRAANISTQELLKAEEAALKAHLPEASLKIILDERGRELTTLEFAGALQGWQEQNAFPCFVIGGADGISASLKAESAMLLSLSKMTLPHALARVILIEQIYRAVSVLNHHPYHRF